MTKPRYPIPDEALDDRLGAVGTSGSGKTYNVGTAVERLLESGRRVGVVDPLGVWWGVRMFANGKKATTWPVVIFGGPHGDLPLSENAGHLIAETCAGMEESFILDLSELGTRAAERRFMLAFLSTLYRRSSEPLHLVLDESDMWAPQHVQDKDGGALKLLSTVETIVRRGRVKGFIPWLITQRPAVLNKNVLSQVDGLIAMKLTSSQDRAALGGWIEGQADKADAKRILDSLPSLKLGTGVVWIPARGILETADFPRKTTFDSSRTPKRGETKRSVTLKPVNVDALRDKLATIEVEVAASDPAKLKARIAELERAAKSKGKAAIDALAAPSKADLIAAKREGVAIGSGHIKDALEALKVKLLADLKLRIDAAFDRIVAEPVRVPATPALPAGVVTANREYMETRRRLEQRRLPPDANLTPAAATAVLDRQADDLAITPYQRDLLNSLALWEAIGKRFPSPPMVAVGARKSHTSSTFTQYVRTLRSAGLLDIPSPGKLTLTDAGRAIADPPDRSVSIRERLNAVLTPYQQKLVDALPRDGSPFTRDELAVAIDQSSTSSTFTQYLRQLRTYGVVELIGQSVSVETWVWQ